MHWCLLSLPRLGKSFSYGFIERFSLCVPCFLPLGASICVFTVSQMLLCAFVFLFQYLKRMLSSLNFFFPSRASHVAFWFWHVATSNLFQPPVLTFSCVMIWFPGFVEFCFCVLLNLTVALHALFWIPWQIFCYPGSLLLESYCVVHRSHVTLFFWVSCHLPLSVAQLLNKSLPPLQRWYLSCLTLKLWPKVIAQSYAGFGSNWTP